MINYLQKNGILCVGRTVIYLKGLKKTIQDFTI